MCKDTVHDSKVSERVYNKINVIRIKSVFLILHVNERPDDTSKLYSNYTYFDSPVLYFKYDLP